MTTTTTTKMALNNSSSVDRDTLREQQRQARAQAKMDTSDTSIITNSLFAEPIFKLANANAMDDPLTKRIHKTLGEYKLVKDAIFSNPKNLIGITSQPQTPLLDSVPQLVPHFSDVSKTAKPPLVNVNGFRTSSGGVGGGDHHHNHRGGSSSGGVRPGGGSSSNTSLGTGSGVGAPAAALSSNSSNSRSNNAVSASRSGANNGWNSSSSQVKQTGDSYSAAKQKPMFKSHSPVPPLNVNHLPVPAANSQDSTRDQCSPARLGADIAKAPSAQLSHSVHHHSSSLPSSTALTSSTKSAEHTPRVNGALFNGAIKSSSSNYGRHSSVKPQLRINIEEATKANQDHAELESILKEMIAPTPLTEIPTPRKDETRFAFSSVAAAAPSSSHLPTVSPSSERSSSKTVVRALDKSLSGGSSGSTPAAPLPPLGANNGASILVSDLEISDDSGDESGGFGKKPVPLPRHVAISSGLSVVNNPPAPVAAATDSDDEESSESESSESSDVEDFAKSNSEPEHSDEEVKAQAPKENWNLNNFMPPQSAVPFGLPSDTSFLVPEKSSSNNHHNSSNSTNKLTVCDPPSNSRRPTSRAKDQLLQNDDIDNVTVPDIKTLIPSPSRDSLTYLAYSRNDEAFSRMMEDVPTVSPQLSPSSPSYSQPPPISISTTTRTSSSHQNTKRSSVSPRSRSPAAASISSYSSTLSQSRESNKVLAGRELKETIGGKKPLLPDPVQEEKHEEKLTSSSKEQSSKSKHKRPSKSEKESTTKDKSVKNREYRSEVGASKDEGSSRKVASSTKRPRTPPGPPPPSPPPLTVPKSLVRQNSNGSSKSSDTSLISSSGSSKQPVSSSALKSASANKVYLKQETKENDSKKNKKSVQNIKKPRSSQKFQSKELITDTEDSDSDADIDVGVGSPPPQPPPISKSSVNTVGDKSGAKVLSKFSHFSSSSVADSVEDVSAVGTVGSTKSKSNVSSSRNLNAPSSISRKSKIHTQQNVLKTVSPACRDEAKSKTSSADKMAEEWIQIPAPLSPLRSDDFKEQETKFKAKDISHQPVRIAPMTYRDGYPSLIVTLDKSLLDRLPPFPPTQLRLSDDNLTSTRKVESSEKKAKSEHKRPDNSSSTTVKSEMKQRHTSSNDSSGGKENNAVGQNISNNNNKLDTKVNKRPLQDSEIKKSEVKKLKLSSKERDSSLSETLVVKSKTSSSDNVKVKKEEIQSEDIANLKSSSSVKNSPSNRLSSSEVTGKKSSRSSIHKSSPSRRDKKHSSQSTTPSGAKKDKSSRDNDLTGKTTGETEGDSSRSKKSNYQSSTSANEIKKEGSSSLYGDCAVATTSSSLTASGLSKENKQRGRECLETAGTKKRKCSGSSGSSASQTTSVSSLTETQKAITSEGIERNTNHDRIQSAHEFNSTKSSNSACTSSRDWVAALERINEIISVRSNDSYVNHAKSLKHEADKELDRTAQVTKYLHAALYFMLSGLCLENERSNPQVVVITMYVNTLDLVKFVSSKFRSHQSTNGNATIENKISVLSLWCQSILNLKLYNMKKNEVRDFQKTISEYQKTPVLRPGSRQMASPGQSSCAANAVSSSLWNGKVNGAPSPMSPLPSPAGSVGSVESQSSGYSSSEIGQQSRSNSGNNCGNSSGGGGSGNNISHGGGSSSANMAAALTNPAASTVHSSLLQTISIPVHIHSTMQKQLVNLNYLSASYDMWEQAEALIHRGGNQDFFKGLEERCGKLTMVSTLEQLVRHIMMGLHMLNVNVC